MKLSRDQFLDITRRWNEQALGINMPVLDSYDAALNYFKTLPPNTIKAIAQTGMDTLPTEAYAALSMWHDIIKTPHRISKIHQSGLTRPAHAQSITELAKAGDILQVLYAVRDRVAEKLDSGAGTRDTALLTRQMTDVLEQIGELERKQGPKQTTELGKLLSSVKAGKQGARKTIDD